MSFSDSTLKKFPPRIVYPHMLYTYWHKIKKMGAMAHHYEPG